MIGFFDDFIDRVVARAVGEGREPRRPTDARVKAEKIKDLDIGKLDPTGEEVRCFYGRKPPDFAVYRTEQRVSIQFADDTVTANRQRRAIATLNPVRGEINGLIDGWRSRPYDDPGYQRAKRFDRRVGDALVVAFEDDVADAALILARIRQDILDQRVASARFEYLFAAFAAAVAFILLVTLFVGTPQGHGQSLWAAAKAGGVGAFFSIAIGLRGRTVLPDLLWLANTMDAILRVLIGVIGAAVLMALVDLKLFKLTLGAAGEADGAGCSSLWLNVLVIGFIAGFSERLVPDLLEKATNKPAETPPSRPLVRGLSASSGAGQSGREHSGGAEQSGDDLAEPHLAEPHLAKQHPAEPHEGAGAKPKETAETADAGSGKV